MKILWFTGTVNKKANNSYGGGGWIASLTKELNTNSNITLAQSFFCDMPESLYMEGNISFYPMCKKSRSKIFKLMYYWKKSYKNIYSTDDVELMQDVINDFKPDIIQIFGLESRFCSILDYIKVPTIIYLQGILNPIYNAFFPVGMNKFSFLYSRFSSKEWIYRNAIIYSNEAMKYRSKYEIETLHKISYLIGRTKFDYQVTNFFASHAKYFSLNEMMKDVFYESQVWKKNDNKKYVIYTTISNVTYKGLDLILKTSKLLTEYNNIDFEWQIAGINKDSELVYFFEKILNINSSDVNIKYNGIVPDGKLVEHLLRADVFVHPSYIDNSPNSICEAQLVGIPVIACNVGGVSDFITHGKTGVLIPANAPFELASIIKKDMKTPYLKSYTQEARNVALQRHNKQDIVDQLIDIYHFIYNENCCSSSYLS
jgi:glycosyltransferase involved in cell wall biosynthesis